MQWTMLKKKEHGRWVEFPVASSNKKKKKPKKTHQGHYSLKQPLRGKKIKLTSIFKISSWTYVSHYPLLSKQKFFSFFCLYLFTPCSPSQYKWIISKSISLRKD